MGDMEQDFKERTKEQYEAIDDFKEHGRAIRSKNSEPLGPS